jgi:Iron-containing redox enzyme
MLAPSLAWVFPTTRADARARESPFVLAESYTRHSATLRHPGVKPAAAPFRSFRNFLSKPEVTHALTKRWKPVLAGITMSLRRPTMARARVEWTRWAGDLEGQRFAEFQTQLSRHNAHRFRPGLPEEAASDELATDERVARAEIEMVEALRRAVAPLIAKIPAEPDGFIAWFEELKHTGPGQGDPLFPWLATTAGIEQMKWFLFQEVAGEAGFEDLLAMTQVKMPVQAKLEMARNFWDEMGRGSEKGMHGPMLERLAGFFQLSPAPETVVPEALALGNTMIALARHRRYAFHSIGALGVIEMTAPGRAALVNAALRRLRIPAKKRLYFAVHAVLDVKHSEAWNAEVLHSLVAEDPRRARAIGEGAVIRLWHGARCFERYRCELGLAFIQSEAA